MVKSLKCGPQGGKKEEADGDIKLQDWHFKKRNPVSFSKPFLLNGWEADCICDKWYASIEICKLIGQTHG